MLDPNEIANLVARGLIKLIAVVFAIALAIGFAAGWALGQTLPPGFVPLTATIETANRAGGPHLVGHGGILPLEHAKHFAGDHTTFLVDGISPAVRLRGRDRTVSDFTLLGKGKPAIGLLMDWDAGLGTGKYTIERLNIQGFKIGIQAGADASEDNCDQTSVSKVFFRNCDKGFAFMQAQAMGWYVRDTEFEADSPDDVAFYYEGGGDLSAYDTFVPYGCRLLQLNAVGQMFGGNNSGYRFHGVKVDAQAGTDFCLVHCDDTAYDYCLDADVWVDGLMMPIAPDYNGKLLATVTGSSRLTIRDSKIACKLTKALAWRQEDPRFMPSIKIENCRLTGHKSCAEMINRSKGHGLCLFIFENNYTSAGKLPNYIVLAQGDKS